MTRQQKLRLYRVGICPRIAWDLAINNFPISWVKRKLEATATRSLKKWSGLAKSADTARVYLPQSQGGLGLPSLSLLFQKQQVSQACQLLTSRDPAVRYTSTLETKRQEASQRTTHKPMLTARRYPDRRSWHDEKSTCEKSKVVCVQRRCRKEVRACKPPSVSRPGLQMLRGHSC